MIVVPLPGDLAVYWSVPRVPFPPSEDGIRDHVGDISVFPSWCGRHTARVRDTFVLDMRKYHYTHLAEENTEAQKERNVPKVTEPLAGLLVAQKQIQWNGTLDSTTPSVWCQME